MICPTCRAVMKHRYGRNGVFYYCPSEYCKQESIAATEPPTPKVLQQIEDMLMEDCDVYFEGDSKPVEDKTAELDFNED